MNRYFSNSTADAFVAVARLILGHIECGNIRAEPGREKMLADLRRKAAHALELGQRRRQVKK